MTKSLRKQTRSSASTYLVIKKTGSDKHMWNCATTIQFLEFLTVELRERRLELGLAAKDGALSICDDAEQHRNPQYIHSCNCGSSGKRKITVFSWGVIPSKEFQEAAFVFYIHKTSI